jgi:hypothetical protein
MLSSRRWRDWNPPAIFQKCPERELTKPTEPLPSSVLSVLSVPTLPAPEINVPSDSALPHHSVKWRKPFSRWLDSVCVRSPRCFGGVARLHIAFCEWAVRQGGPPCTRETFEWLLTERGFLVGEVSGVVLVSGLTFREDFEVYL